MHAEIIHPNGTLTIQSILNWDKLKLIQSPKPRPEFAWNSTTPFYTEDTVIRYPPPEIEFFYNCELDTDTAHVHWEWAYTLQEIVRTATELRIGDNRSPRRLVWVLEIGHSSLSDIQRYKKNHQDQEKQYMKGIITFAPHSYDKPRELIPVLIDGSGNTLIDASGNVLST